MATLNAGEVRSHRLNSPVSNAENAVIGQRAEAAGLSVSAYLREMALGPPADGSEAAALRQIDAMIDRMEGDLDGAITELSATLARLAAT